MAEDWPQFLGPTRDGVSHEPGLAAALDSGGRELWRKPLGKAYSGLVVAGSVAYTMAMEDSGEVLVALSADSGAERWRLKLGPAPENSGYPGPRATPTVAGDVVVALSSGGMLAAVGREDGKARWVVDIVKTLGGTVPTWGYAGSPLVLDGKVYLAVGGSQSGLVALSLTDGTVAWRRPGYEAGYASPLYAELGHTPQILFFAAKAIVGLRPADGTVVWEYPWITNYDVNAASPVVIGSERLFIASAYGVGASALLVTPPRGVELWRTKSMKNKLATSVLSGGHLYGFNEDQLASVNATDGTVAWTASGYGRGTLVLVDNRLIVVDEQCRLSVVAAEPAALRVVTPARSILTGGTCWTAPAVSNGVLYTRNLTEVVAWELRGYGPRASP